MLRLLPSYAPSLAPDRLPAAWAMGTLGTAVLFALTAAAGSAPRPAAREQPPQRVKYLLPPKPGDVPYAEERVHWIAPFTRGGGQNGLNVVRGPVGGMHVYRAKGPRLSIPIPAPAAAPVPEGGRVYVESELDKAAQRDPASAAPQYPAYLEAQGIQGAATVQFVVDSNGRADSVSFSVLDATHPAFAEAVRGALTGMLFSPAEINGHHVRQWVQQSFQFVIQHPTRMVATAGGAAGAGGAH